MRVSLRLEDNSRFLGTADVRLMPTEGYEAVGTPGGAEGEILFTGLAPGKYTIEASSPGYLLARVSTQIDTGHHERVYYLVMKLRPIVKKEEVPAGEPVTATPTATGANAFVAVPNAGAPEAVDFWVDHELEMNVPAVDSSVQCPMASVLKGAGQRMKEFVNNLEKFAATEVVEHYWVNAGKKQGQPEKRRFDYVVTVSQNSIGTFLLEEYRDGSTDPEKFPAGVATQGLPALDLIFHPVLAGDFQFACEGLGEANGKAAWQVHFAQRADRRVRIRSYTVGERTYRVNLEGRSWIDPGNYQVVRLETELMKPIPEISLTKERMVVNYAPVEFLSQKEQIWLPREANLYVERKGRRYYRRHTFTDFKVFSVETAQSDQAPKASYSFINNSDGDITGVLTVIPEEGTKREAVSISVMVPARGRVFKVVGVGKDVNLPAAEVASAKFEHEGKADSVKVEANLVKETTLDVIPEIVMTKP